MSCTKRTYGTRREARSALKRMVGMGRADLCENNRLGVYRCECGKLHLGHIPSAVKAGQAPAQVLP